ncbi:MAG: DUF5818 domain-containing protein [Bryobacteraceae bacterium]
MRLLATLLFAGILTMFAAPTKWVGWITDEKCAAAGKLTGDHQRCLQTGGRMVFVNDADKKVYKLTNEDKAKELVGRKVNLTGTEKGDTIEVEDVTENVS